MALIAAVRNAVAPVMRISTSALATVESVARAMVPVRMLRMFIVGIWMVGGVVWFGDRVVWDED